MGRDSSLLATPGAVSDVDKLHENARTPLVRGSLFPAVCSGALQAVLFNPYDKALYVRVQFRRRHFLDWRNFEHPFQGFGNAAFYRTIVGASYIFWQDFFRHCLGALPFAGDPDGPLLARPHPLNERNYPVLYPCITGLLAGSASALALNNLQAIKFRMWSSAGYSNVAADAMAEKGGSAATSALKHPTLIGTARYMYAEGGIRVFFRGVKVSVLRDAIFGVTYETLRHSAAMARAAESVHIFYRVESRRLYRLCTKGFTSDASASAERAAYRQELRSRRATRPEDCNSQAFVLNMLAACMGTILSSPLNYLRSIIYGADPNSFVPRLSTLVQQNIMGARFVLLHGHTYLEAAKTVDHKYTKEASIINSAGNKEQQGTTATSDSSIKTRETVADTHAKTTSKTTSISRSAETTLRSGSNSTEGRGFTRRFLLSNGPAVAPRKRYHLLATWRYVNARLNIGWGSVRVGLGMAVGQQAFGLVKKLVA